MWLTSFAFVVEGIILIMVACFGLVGNILSFIILSTQEVHKTFHNLLMLLSGFDMVSRIIQIIVLCEQKRSCGSALLKLTI